MAKICATGQTAEAPQLAHQDTPNDATRGVDCECYRVARHRAARHPRRDSDDKRVIHGKQEDQS